MRKTIFTCDRCGKTIKDGSYIVRGEIWGESGEVIATYEHGLFELDFCAACMREVLNSAVRCAHEITEEVDKTEKDKARRIDTGKIGALRRAGWSLKAISEEMGCSIQTVCNHLKKLEEGNGNGEV